MNRQEVSFSLEDIDPQFRSQIRQIMTACGVTPEEAYECLLLHSLSVQDCISALKHRGVANHGSWAHTNSRVADRGFVDYGQYDDSDEEYEPYFYYQLQEGKKCFFEKYPVDLKFMQSKHRGIQSSNSIDRIQTKSNDILKSKLIEIIKDPSWIPTNEVSSLEQALCISYTQKVPILLLNTDLSPEIRTNITDLFSAPAFKKILQSQFIYFAIYDNQYKLEKWLEPHIDLLSTLNSIIILRVNIYDDIEITSIITLHQKGDQIRENIKRVKSQITKKTLDEKYIKYTHKMIKQGRSWRRPVSFMAKKKKKEEQKRLLSNHRIRKEQEQAYQELAVHAKQQAYQKNQKQEQEISNKAQYYRNLNVKREKLAKYREGLNFKIRVPSGSNIYVVAPLTESIQYLYDTVQCKEEDLGFENDCPRKFDLYVGLGVTATLNGKRDQRIGEVFESGELLIVRQVE